eukprot:15433252-Alexandrium_andersonii.AAC.1
MTMQQGRETLLKDVEGFPMKGLHGETRRVCKNVASHQREQGQMLRLLVTARKQVVGYYKNPVPLWDHDGFKLRGDHKWEGFIRGGGEPGTPEEHHKVFYVPADTDLGEYRR